MQWVHQLFFYLGLWNAFLGDQTNWNIATQLAGRLGLRQLQRLRWLRPPMVGVVPRRIGIEVVHSFTPLGICMSLDKWHDKLYIFIYIYIYINSSKGQRVDLVMWVHLCSIFLPMWPSCWWFDALEVTAFCKHSSSNPSNVFFET